MRLLAIDTTGQFGSIALAEDGIVVAERLLHSPEGFGHLLFGAIEEMLLQQSWDLAAIDGFAGAAGPGSFTGVRVGLAAVKGLAEATGKPAYAISNLQALAALGNSGLRATVIDARRGEVYAALYDAELREVQAEQVLPFRAWIDGLPESCGEFLSNDFGPFRGAFAESRFAAAVVEEQRSLAGAVARVAAMSPGRDSAAIDANYVRRSDAELMWKES